jgi:hypothetical protein
VGRRPLSETVFVRSKIVRQEALRASFGKNSKNFVLSTVQYLTMPLRKLAGNVGFYSFLKPRGR